MKNCKVCNAEMQCVIGSYYTCPNEKAHKASRITPLADSLKMSFDPIPDNIKIPIWAQHSEVEGIITAMVSHNGILEEIEIDGKTYGLVSTYLPLYVVEDAFKDDTPIIAKVLLGKVTRIEIAP